MCTDITQCWALRQYFWTAVRAYESTHDLERKVFTVLLTSAVCIEYLQFPRVVPFFRVRLSFTITPEDFGGQKHDDVVATICRTSLARAVEVKYGSGKALSEITLKAFENDLRPKVSWSGSRKCRNMI